MKSGTKSVVSQSSKLLLGASILGSAWVALLPTAIAQNSAATDQASTGEQSQGLEEVVVTARKRAEKLQDIPEAITAVTSSTLDQRDIVSLKDIATLTPSLTISNYSAERVDPNQQTVVLRGVASSVSGVGIFINGAPAGNGFAADISLLDRVEVLKGPQSAYFGRATFSGAINYVTKTPSENWRMTGDALYGSDNQIDVRGSIEGPIIPDVLSFRINARHFTEEGQYKGADDGATLGNQRTTSVAGVFDYHGIDNLKVVWTALYRENTQDEPVYAKFNSLSGNFNCAAGGGTPVTALNYICGQLPSTFPANQLGTDFPLNATTSSILLHNGGNITNPGNLNILVGGPGSVARVAHTNLRADYSIDNTGTLLDGATLSYIGEVERSDSSFLTNSEGQPLNGIAAALNPNFGKIPNVTQYVTYLIASASASYDMYHEMRLTSAQDQPVRAMLGVSYFYSGAPPGLIYGIAPTGLTNFGGTGQTSTTENWGAFGSLAWDIFPELTAEFDWRFQVDHLTLDAHYPPAHQFASDLDPEFMPRGSLQYKIDPELTAYTSFAVGINPQAFNSTLFGLPPSVLASIQAQSGAGLVVQGERIEESEIGLKGSLFDGRVAFDTDIYYGNWTNQVVSQPIVAQNALNGQLLPGTTIYRPSTNLGRTEIYGYELQFAAKLTPNLTANATLGVNQTQVDSYNCQACLTIDGRTSVKGNALPGIPDVTSNLFLEYRDQVPFAADYQWYINGQYTHSGSFYTDLTNIAYTAPRNTADFRLGIESDRFTVEGFVVNAFNDYYYTSAVRDTNLAPGQPNAIYVGLPLLRQYGIRVHYEFGDFGGASETHDAAYVPPPVVAPAPAPRSYLVFFDFNKSDLTPQAVNIVDMAAKTASATKVTKLEVTGHTDTVGSDAYNMRLSRRRAESVAGELEKQGIASSEIEIVAKGKHDLLVPTADGVKEPQNRRVQILYEDGSPSS
jgi:iron complex outermembrane receptor protein